VNNAKSECACRVADGDLVSVCHQPIEFAVGVCHHSIKFAVRTLGANSLAAWQQSQCGQAVVAANVLNNRISAVEVWQKCKLLLLQKNLSLSARTERISYQYMPK
jgi:hypothetical protein